MSRRASVSLPYSEQDLTWRGKQAGSHIILRKDTYTPIVPNHPGKIKPGTMRSIIRQAGMTVEEFLELL